MIVTALDVAWAAGFLEGEACFSKSKTTINIQCSQVQREPLERLQRIFGGKIYDCGKNRPKPYGTWSLYGNAAAGVMMTVLGLMSPRRTSQIVAALDFWKRPLNRSQDRTHCPRGHEYAGDNLIFSKSGGRLCRECRNSAGRASYHSKRQAMLVAERL